MELQLWYQALVSEYGIVVKTDKPDLAIQRLYKARRNANDPELYKLHIRRFPTELWIVKNEVDNGAEE